MWLGGCGVGSPARDWGARGHARQVAQGAARLGGQRIRQLFTHQTVEDRGGEAFLPGHLALPEDNGLENSVRPATAEGSHGTASPLATSFGREGVGDESVQAVRSPKAFERGEGLGLAGHVPEGHGAGFAGLEVRCKGGIPAAGNGGPGEIQEALSVLFAGRDHGALSLYRFR